MEFETKNEQYRQELTVIWDNLENKGDFLESILEWATNHPDSALHAYVGKNWNDAHAAHQHRLHLIRKLLVRVNYEEGSPIRKFVSIVINDGDEGPIRRYTDIQVVTSNHDLASQLIGRLCRRLENDIAELLRYQEFFEIINADEAVTQIKLLIDYLRQEERRLENI